VRRLDDILVLKEAGGSEDLLSVLGLFGHVAPGDQPGLGQRGAPVFAELARGVV
jgi:hypothetical protein